MSFFRTKKFPVFSQLDTRDCGPACLRMVSKYYGRTYSVFSLREKTHIAKDGVSLTDLGEASETIGMKSLIVKVSLSELKKENPTPFIAHWNQSHYVVVYGFKNNKVIVGDPAVGKLLYYTEKDFLKSWASTLYEGEQAGIALLLETTPDFYIYQDVMANGSNKKLSFGYLLGYLRPHQYSLWQIAFGLLAGSLLGLLFPLLTQNVVDVGVNTKNISFIFIILMAQFSLSIGRLFIELIRGWILLYLTAKLNLSLLSGFLLKLVRLPIAFFDSRRTADLLQRMQDNQRIQNLLSTSSLSILFSLLNFLIFGFLLSYYNLTIFGVFLLCSVLYFSWISIFLGQRKKLDYQRFQQYSTNQGQLLEMLSGMQSIKLHNAETLKRWEWERLQAKNFRLQIKSNTLEQYQQAGGTIINESMQIIITFLSAKAVIDGQMTLGMMLSVQYLIGQLSSPIHQFIQFIKEFQDAQISLERLNEVQSQPAEDEQKVLVNYLPEQKSIFFDAVTFQYEGASSPKVLDNISLRIPEGKVTAIVGESGSGKTTLLKLLLKFYKPIQGDIRIGSLPLENINSKEWRKLCGTVMQDGYIFSDTINQNICMTEESFMYEKVKNATKTAEIHSFIENLPLGYYTKIGAEGTGLSGGQKQRILLARAIYRNPTYLFLDEATSSLDANTEKAIIDNLERFYQGKTVVIIAHRLSTVMHADQIVVLNKGKIVEVGTHSELAANKQGMYFELVKNQLTLGE